MVKTFDLTAFDISDVILLAIKSEVESKQVYTGLAARTKNAFLKDKLEFLASEEGKHKSYLENIFKKLFPDKSIELPAGNLVPLPEVKVTPEKKLSDLLEEAMEAELASQGYYQSMSELFHDKPEVKKATELLSKMEHSHYKLIELEKENVKLFDNYEEGWEFMHIGP